MLLNFKNNFDKNIKGISFNCVGNILGDTFLNSKFKKFDIACSIQKNNYQGNLQPQLIVKDAILLD